MENKSKVTTERSFVPKKSDSASKKRPDESKTNQSWVRNRAIEMDKFLDKKYKSVRSENLEELLAEVGV